MTTFEEKIQAAYRHEASWAKRYYYAFSRPTVTVGGTPCALFLGNHSSGKSSLVNWALGGAAVQDTGVAPTDDGFTVIQYGETEEETCGPAALARLPREFETLQTLGPLFLQRLRVKTRPLDALRRLTLIDSPGMIDAASGAVSRDYDFHAAVRQFAERADTVFFLFDPDKPGTTGETLDVFARDLRGLEFKVRVLLNKCDQFTSLYDFARAYGTVCWNLARVLHTKDLPKIYTTYTGDAPATPPAGMDFADFERHRAEFRATLLNGTARRADSVRAAAYFDFMGLALRIAVIDEAQYRLSRVALGVVCLGLAVGGGVGTVVARALRAADGSFPWFALAAGALACVGALFVLVQLYQPLRRLHSRRLADAVDALFTAAYRHETAAGLQDDLRQAWAAQRDETAEIIRSATISRPLFARHHARQLETFARDLMKT